MDDWPGWKGAIWTQYCCLAGITSPTLSSPLPIVTCYRRGLLSPSDQESEGSEEVLKVTVAIEFAQPPPGPLPIAMAPMNYNL